ncbi:TPR repeat-containing protein [Kaistia sp. 32K]|uniref:tetratricopeptide repeat protein n=1 Tax=Kaistia sp. 32K TaxID=2795690 RepID=UPI0019389126|nr:tetratricopeptide repeat protein [Kaistia sp. 32K]BCP53940.1 TPR repeat-containing protein [Kaistia sp. 32K]
MASLRDTLEARLKVGQDNALLRFSLGSFCLKEGDAAAAVEHFRRAVELDGDYSAAWAQLGKALGLAGDAGAAADAYASGIEAAERRGDLQAAKQMRVFLRRLDPGRSQSVIE